MSLGVPLRWGSTSVKAGQNTFPSQTRTLYESDNTTNEKGTPLVERGSEQALHFTDEETEAWAGEPPPGHTTSWRLTKTGVSKYCCQLPPSQGISMPLPSAVEHLPLRLHVSGLLPAPSSDHLTLHTCHHIRLHKLSCKCTCYLRTHLADCSTRLREACNNSIDTQNGGAGV